MCATKEGEVGDFLNPKDSADILAFGHNLAKAQGAFPKVLDTETLNDYLESPEEMAPVNSIVGGVLANEVLKAISGKGDPFDNLFLYSMANGAGIVEKVGLAVPITKPVASFPPQIDQTQHIISV